MELALGLDVSSSRTTNATVLDGLRGTSVGLYRGDDFLLVLVDDHANYALPQALWYFSGEWIAVPRRVADHAGFTRAVPAFADVAAWIEQHARHDDGHLPDLVWIGSPQCLDGATLTADGSRLAFNHTSLSVALVAQFRLNRSFFDASSARFFSQRKVRARGVIESGWITVRTLWPEDFRLSLTSESDARTVHTVLNAAALRALTRAMPQGGAQSPFATETLWTRKVTTEDWRGRPVIALLLNGAQGDDDEAQGGHFALVTGRIGPNGEFADWLVSNFYTLDAVSEKGTIASMLPLDNYLADLNSGQQYYRPGYLLVAVLSIERTARLAQGALARVFNQFYRHQLEYAHARMNCAGITIDTLRALGWRIPRAGATSRIVAALCWPWMTIKTKSFAKGRMAVEYLWEERARLLPAVAFEQAGADLFALASASAKRRLSSFERELENDIDALIWVRMPQFPSSRAWGDAPVATLTEYHARIPADPADAQIIPLPPRPFPPTLRDADLLPPRLRVSTVVIVGWSLALACGALAAIAWALDR